MPVHKEGFFSPLVEEAEVVRGEEVGKFVGLVVVFAKIVVSRPDGMVEVEVSEEDGVGVHCLDSLHGFDGGVVYIVVDIEDHDGEGG